MGKEMSDTENVGIGTLRYLWDELRDIEKQIVPLEKEKESIRERIGILVSQLGTVILPGYGKALITAPSKTHSYDKGKIDELIIEIMEENPTIARRLVAARRFTERDGSLRIENEKPKS